MEQGQRTIRRNGHKRARRTTQSSIAYADIRYAFWHDTLVSFIGSAVDIRVPLGDLRRIQVYWRGQFLCSAYRVHLGAGR